MKMLHLTRFKSICLLSLASILLGAESSSAQPCGSAQGDQTSYGANNVWIGYAYQGKTFNTYYGYVNEGVSGNSNFDESFGGDQVNYATHGCSVYTENFSVRYRLSQTFSNGNYLFTVGGDDGYRLSLDGGATWAINNWGDHGYTTSTYTIALNGSYNMVLEYYENGGGNRVSFSVAPICMGTGDPTVYGTNNIWQAYIYQGMNFDMYKGSLTEGTVGDPHFDENFGTSGNTPVTYTTNSCSIQTQQFSVRYRLRKTLVANNYTITVGGDDGFRLSLDGGSTWVINKWNDQSYAVAGYSAALSGTYNMVLEYYQNAGNNRVSFSLSSSILPVSVVSWSATAVSAGQEQLQWKITDAINFDHFDIQRSTDGQTFTELHTIPSNTTSDGYYAYMDRTTYSGTLYYRLAMVDQNGHTSYSNIVALSQQETRGASIFPTVVENGNLFVETTQPVNQARLELFDMSGRKISEKDWAMLSGRQEVAITGSRSTLTPGLYVARLSNNNSILAKQIIMIK